MKQFLDKLKDKQDLTFEESKSAFELLMTGKATEDEIYSFLTLLSDKGEVADEIAGGVYVLREKSKRVNITNCIDTCGTGGSGKKGMNISSAISIILSGMGHKVIKHGNTAQTGNVGSAELFRELGVKITDDRKYLEEFYFKNNFVFLFAPFFHPGLVEMGRIRKSSEVI